MWQVVLVLNVYTKFQENSLFHLSFIMYYETSPHMFSIFIHVMKPVSDTNSEPGLPVTSILQV